MFGKQLMFAAGVGVGYVLGTRAGRERYESIMRSLRELKERPEFQETAAVVTGQAGQIAGTLAGRARGVMGAARSAGGGSGSDQRDAHGDGAGPSTDGPTERTA